MNKLYCETCHQLFEEDVCPDCGSLGRHVQPSDYCLLTTQPGIYAGMLCDILKQNEIPAVSRATQGAMGLFSSLNMEEHQIFVPYDRMEAAEGCLQDFLSAEPVPEEEETEADP